MMITAIKGDITKQRVDAIVNAANPSLMGGGGVDGAIHRAGGPTVLEECKKIIAIQGICKTGEAVITGAGNLPAKFVIHTVGPIWKGGAYGEAEQLGNCYKNCLTLAARNDCGNISFPCISVGAYGYPKEAAAAIAVQATRVFFDSHTIIQNVCFVCFDDLNFLCYQSLLKI